MKTRWLQGLVYLNIALAQVECVALVFRVWLGGNFRFFFIGATMAVLQILLTLTLTLVYAHAVVKLADDDAWPSRALDAKMALFPAAHLFTFVAVVGLAFELRATNPESKGALLRPHFLPILSACYCVFALYSAVFWFLLHRELGRRRDRAEKGLAARMKWESYLSDPSSMT